MAGDWMNIFTYMQEVERGVVQQSVLKQHLQPSAYVVMVIVMLAVMLAASWTNKPKEILLTIHVVFF